MNSINGRTVKLSEICYYLFFAGLLFAKGIGLYDGQVAFKIILVVSGLFWLAKMVLTEYSWKELAIIAGLLLLSGIAYLVSGDKGLLLYAMMVVGAKNIPVKKIFIVGAVTWTAAFGGIFILTASHWIESPFKVHEKGMGLIIRWGLGYSHPNVLHVSYLIFCILIGYILTEKMNWKWLLALMIGNGFTFLYSVSFTGFIATTVYLILCFYWLCRKKVRIVEHILIKAGAAFCVAFAMLAPVLLQGRLFETLNNLLNTRLRLSRHFLTTYPFSLFGKKLADITASSLTMDSSYVYAYVAYGGIVFSLLILGYACIIHRYCKQQKGTELCIILASLAAGVTEPFLFNASFKNISLIFFSELIYREKKEGIKYFNLLNRFDFSFDLSTQGVEGIGSELQAIYSQKKKRLLFVLLAGMIIGATGYNILAVPPERIIVPRSECDFDESEYLELTVKSNEISEKDQVYGKIHEDTVLVALSGNAIRLERCRNIVWAGTLSGCVFMLAGIFIYCFKWKTCRIKAERKK